MWLSVQRILKGELPGARWFRVRKLAQGGIDVLYVSSMYKLLKPTMPEEAVFTMNLEPELRDAVMAEAETSHRPTSQVVRELVREFVKRQRQAREYDAFLRSKVDIARAQKASGQVLSSADVEARFAARRAALRAKAGAAGA